MSYFFDFVDFVENKAPRLIREGAIAILLLTILGLIFREFGLEALFLKIICAVGALAGFTALTWATVLISDRRWRKKHPNADIRQ
jgi:hypothetical protein